jgi:hypothetical protein
MAHLPSREKCREKIQRHFRNRTGVLPLAERLGAENSNPVPHRLARQMAQTGRDDTNLMPIFYKPLGDGRRHTPPTPADRWIFVAEDEDFHGRNRS